MDEAPCSRPDCPQDNCKVLEGRVDRAIGSVPQNPQVKKSGPFAVRSADFLTWDVGCRGAGGPAPAAAAGGVELAVSVRVRSVPGGDGRATRQAIGALDLGGRCPLP